MGETQGSKSSGKGWLKLKEVSLIRIDHSDVYFENDHLNEELGYSIDNIRRSQYRKQMDWDYEIKQIKQSLQSLRNQKVNHVFKKPEKNSKKTKTISQENRKNILEKGKISRFEQLNKNKEKTLNREPGSVKSIEVKMPSAEDTSSNVEKDVDEDDDEESNESLSDSNEDDKDSRISSNEKSQKTLFSRTVSLNSSAIRRYSRPNTSISTNYISKESQKKGKDVLKCLLSRLQLERVPPSWYRDVLPAADVHTTKRTCIKKERIPQLSPNRNSHGTHKKPKDIRPSTGGDVFHRTHSKQPYIMHKTQLRPSTSLGFVRNDRSGGRDKMYNKLQKSSETNQSTNGLVCDKKQETKTMWQLKEEVYKPPDAENMSRAQIVLAEVKKEGKLIDNKVKSFVRECEEKEKSDKLKRMMPRSLMISSFKDSPW